MSTGGRGGGVEMVNNPKDLKSIKKPLTITPYPKYV